MLTQIFKNRRNGKGNGNVRGMRIPRFFVTLPISLILTFKNFIYLNSASGASISDQLSHRAETDTRSPLKNDEMEILNPEPAPSIKAPTIIPPTPALTSEQAAIMRRLSAHTIVPILPVGFLSPEPVSYTHLTLPTKA